MPKTDAWLRWAPPLLLLIAAVVRLHRLGSESLWYDETFSAYLASQSPAELIAHTARDIHPPGYYLLLHGWRLLAEPTPSYGLEFLFAWPSLFFGMLVVAVTYPIARRTLGTVPALFALVVATIHPFQVWYAQEVRMYAPAAFCAMLTLWAAHAFVSDPPTKRRRALLLYIVAALLGLYLLYYVAFWLATLNIGVLAYLIRHNRRAASVSIQQHPLWVWLAAQVAIVAGYLPWLPTFLRQALDPPVAPWRPPLHDGWSLLASLTEGIASLITAHAAPSWIGWGGALVAVVVVVCALRTLRPTIAPLNLLVIVVALAPLLLMLAISALGPNVYHVRYMALSATVTPLLIAAVVRDPAAQRWGWALVAAALVLQIAAVDALWRDPRHRADDHRGAVAQLAGAWRPGDAILVNAGWVYPALAVYWPAELDSPQAARPPALAPDVRLTDIDAQIPDLVNAPRLVRTGSVDGAASLGWGLPESDFFAVSTADTHAALESLAQHHQRIWHYRLYDTVSDPQAVIRTWLEQSATRTLEQPISGADYLLLERYDQTAEVRAAQQPAATFDNAIELMTWDAPATIPAGEAIYVELWWSKPQRDGLAASVRLVDEDGQRLAQADEPITQPQGADRPFRQTLALPIPAATPPVRYRLALVVYDGTTLAPFTVEPSNAVQLDRSHVDVTLPTTVPIRRTTVARFDYLRLEEAHLPTTPISPGTDIEVTLVWRPDPGPYRDNYVAALELTPRNRAGWSGNGIATASWYIPLGSEAYPSGVWVAGYPVKQTTTLHLGDALAPGDYTVRLRVLRASDALAIPARNGWWPTPQPVAQIGVLSIAR